MWTRSSRHDRKRRRAVDGQAAFVWRTSLSFETVSAAVEGINHLRLPYGLEDCLNAQEAQQEPMWEFFNVSDLWASVERVRSFNLALVAALDSYIDV